MQRAAQGRASSRSGAIGRPHRTHVPNVPSSSRARASVDELQLLVGPVAQRQVALLGEDLARGGGLRAVGHLAGRDDGLADLLDEAGALVEQDASDRVEIGAVHGRDGTSAVYSMGVPTEEDPMAIAIDPVCGMEVDTATSLLSFEHEGVTYWFCGKGCLLDFQEDPAAFLAADHQPSM